LRFLDFFRKKISPKLFSWNFENFDYLKSIKKPAKSFLQAFLTFDNVLGGESKVD